jgi:hypothetical protein
MQSRCGVALYDKAVPRLLFDLRWRLGSFLKSPFPFIFFERHGGYCSPARVGTGASPVQAERSSAAEFTQTYKQDRGGMTFRLFEVHFPQKTVEVWERIVPDGKIKQYQVSAK